MRDSPFIVKKAQTFGDSEHLGWKSITRIITMKTKLASIGAA